MAAQWPAQGEGALSLVERKRANGYDFAKEMNAGKD